ncbi:MAG TPA: hypothetical protein VHL54_13930 [Actinomycetota bacterium]|nr:hypothetical protein [Actinomycetota bacterium]
MAALIVFELLVAAVFLMPVGGDVETVGTPNGTVLEPYYWSIGTKFLFGAFGGDPVENLSLSTIAIGMGIVVATAAFGHYLLGLGPPPTVPKGPEVTSGRRQV